MKKLFALLLLLFIFGATSNFTVSNRVTYRPSIEGTWDLVSRYSYDAMTVNDMLAPGTGTRQIKMFYNGKVMSRYTPNESVEWFGHGAYEATSYALIEKSNYMPPPMRKIANGNMVLQLDRNRYTQISMDEEGGRIASGNYKRID